MDTTIPDFISKRVQKGEYFFLNLNPDDGESLTIVCGGIETCGASYRVERESFPYYGLEFVVLGNCRVTLNGRTRIVGPGCLFSYPPDASLQLQTNGDKPLIKYFVDFIGAESGSILDRLHTIHGGFLDLSHIPWISENFRQLVECGKALQSQSCQLLFKLILSLIPEEPRRAPNPTTYDTYQRCRAVIDTDYANLHSLSDLASAVHVSSAYLCRIFQMYHSESPVKALTRRKMEYAAKLLYEGTPLVKSVANQVGYDDPYHFSRCFKALFGVAPMGFKRNSKKSMRKRLTL